MNKTKKVYLEIMRIIAVFFVIFNHTSNNGFFLFSLHPTNSLQFWLYLFISIFCKFSVPLFFMISGALLLDDKKDSLKELYKKKIFNIFIILLTFSFVYYIFDIYNNQLSFSFNVFFSRLYSYRLKYHLWYLYAYIAFLITIPFLRSLVKNLKNKYFYYMIILSIILTGILPCLEYLIFHGNITLNNDIRPSWILQSIILYPCIGYYLEHRITLENNKKNNLLILCAVNMLGIFISCYMTYLKGQIDGFLTESDSQTFFGNFILLNAIFIYIITKYIYTNHNILHKFDNLFLSVGKCSFGIYLIHVFVLENFSFIYHIFCFLKNLGINSMISCFIYCFIIMCCSYFSTLIISKIPIIKKIVGF